MHETKFPARLVLIALASVTLLGSGCSRMHFRDRADKDVAALLTQKNIFPDWKIENWHVYPDKKARFADGPGPCGPPDFDNPAYPPDDYAAWLLSPNPQKPKAKYGAGRFEGTGYLDQIAAWDAINRANTPESDELPKPILAAGPGPTTGEPETKADEKREAATAEAVSAVAGGAAAYLFALKSEERPFRLTLEQVIELGLFNSREFQDRREDLYLAALPVTLERFSFAAQAFASENVVREVIGRDVAGGPANRWRLATDAGFGKLFPTGATILFRVANQVVFDLTSGRPDLSFTNLSFTAVQPLLRGGGYAVTLEFLTQTERTLLYAIRSYARFRKVFYVALAGTGDYTNNPYGLQGLAQNLGRAVGNNLTAPTSGYLPTVLRKGNLTNEQKNLAALEKILKLYLNLKEGGVVSDLQVVRVELQYLQSQATLLESTRQYLDFVDNFKLQLGVPTNLPIELDDAPLRPMRLQVQKIEQVYEQLQAVQVAASKYDPKSQPSEYRERWKKLFTESELAKGTPFAKDYLERSAAIGKLSANQLAERIKTLIETRRKLLDEQAERQAAGKPEPATEAKSIEDIDNNLDFARFESALREYEAKPWLRLIPDRQANERASLFRTASDQGVLIALRARNNRLDRIRENWPKLPEILVEGEDLLRVPLDDAMTRVAQTALTNRLDLMNARAQVVDAYRQIAVRANALQGVFDVRYDLTTATPADENTPASFAGSRTRHAITLRAEPPFVRRAERNQYRAALISFTRQRRTLMAFEDNILVDCRSEIRQLRALAETYKVQQRTVELAYAQVDNARSTLLAPPDPTAREATTSAASLTEQLLQAQSQLLRAQSALYTNWIAYQNARMNLYLDLELLPLDARGVWTDDINRYNADQTPPNSP